MTRFNTRYPDDSTTPPKQTDSILYLSITAFSTTIRPYDLSPTVFGSLLTAWSFSDNVSLGLVEIKLGGYDDRLSIEFLYTHPHPSQDDPLFPPWSPYSSSFYLVFVESSLEGSVWKSHWESALSKSYSSTGSIDSIPSTTIHAQHNKQQPG